MQQKLQTWFPLLCYILIVTSSSDKYWKKSLQKYITLRQRQINRFSNNNNPLHILGHFTVFHFNPHISIRQIERELGILRSKTYRMLRSILFLPHQPDTGIEWLQTESLSFVDGHLMHYRILLVESKFLLECLFQWQSYIS